jgi:hypothetical protein
MAKRSKVKLDHIPKDIVYIKEAPLWNTGNVSIVQCEAERHKFLKKLNGYSARAFKYDKKMPSPLAAWKVWVGIQYCIAKGKENKIIPHLRQCWAGIQNHGYSDHEFESRFQFERDAITKLFQNLADAKRKGIEIDWEAIVENYYKEKSIRFFSVRFE